MSSRLLCVWLPNWPIQRVQAEEPQLANAPLVLSARDPRRGMVVAAANLAARGEGIKPTMRLSEATALSDVEVREYEPYEDIDVLCTLTEQAQQFSPIVGLEQLDKKLWAGRHLHQPECLLLDVSGLASLFGGERSLLLHIGQWLAGQNYFGCIAVAGSVGAAWANANYALRGTEPTESGEREGEAPAEPDSLNAFKREDAAPAKPNPLEGEDAAPAKPNSPGSAGASPSRDPVSSAGASPSQGLDASLPGDTDVAADEASYSAPPSRFRIVSVGKDADSVARLPIAALRLQADTAESLQRLGIHHIGQLQTLPRDGLATRLGEQLITRWDQVYGRASEPIVTLHGRTDWCLEQSLEYPTRHYETLCRLVGQLSRELSQRLGGAGEGALRLVCRLDQLESQPLVVQLGLFRPSHDAEHWEQLLAGQLEQQMRSLTSTPIWRISLQATLTAPMVWRQADLFDGGEAVNRGQMARLVDTLSSRLGRKQVLGASVKREAQPELAYVLQPLTGRRKDGAEQPTLKKLSSRLARQRAEPSRNDPLRRPSNLFAQPIAIEMRLSADDVQHSSKPAAHAQSDSKQASVSISQALGEQLLGEQTGEGISEPPGQRRKGLPRTFGQFKFQGRWHRVAETRGPERLESGWWRGPSVRREYYRVTTSEGSWWWLYRDLTTGQWYVHGLFD